MLNIGTVSIHVVGPDHNICSPSFFPNFLCWIPPPVFAQSSYFPSFQKDTTCMKECWNDSFQGPFFSLPPRTQGFTEKSGSLQLLSGRHLATTAPWLGSRGHQKSSEGSIHHEELCDCLAVWLWTEVSLYLWASIFRIKQGAGQGWAIPRAPMKGWADCSFLKDVSTEGGQAESKCRPHHPLSNPVPRGHACAGLFFTHTEKQQDYLRPLVQPRSLAQIFCDSFC